MTGRPGQTVAAWRRELAEAVALAPGHLSVYQLTIEPGTAFHRRQAEGELVMPGDDCAADIFEATQEVLAGAGLPAYEISNHAAPGQACRHNLLYWQGGDWLGLGPGAHGRLRRADGRRVATQTVAAVADWLVRVERDGHGALPLEILEEADCLTERLMMGLRLTSGIDRAAFRAEFGWDLTEAIPHGRLARLVEGGLLSLTADRLAATGLGRQCLNGVLERLLPDSPVSRPIQSGESAA
jgi:oxygen-independent coproporphyrinogen-3 oxidase